MKDFFEWLGFTVVVVLIYLLIPIGIVMIIKYFKWLMIILNV